jgi:hypothetical protein
VVKASGILHRQSAVILTKDLQEHLAAVKRFRNASPEAYPKRKKRLAGAPAAMLKRSSNARY